MTVIKSDFPVTLPGLRDPGSVNKRDLVAASREFEGLLLGEILKMSKSDEGAILGAGADDSASTAVDYGVEMMARAIASSGGLGLSAVIEKSFRKDSR